MKILGPDGYAAPNVQMIGGVVIAFCTLGQGIYQFLNAGQHLVVPLIQAALLSAGFLWLAWRGFKKRKASKSNDSPMERGDEKL
jgi:hypothetical protein